MFSDHKIFWDLSFKSRVASIYFGADQKKRKKQVMKNSFKRIQIGSNKILHKFQNGSIAILIDSSLDGGSKRVPKCLGQNVSVGSSFENWFERSKSIK